MAGYDSYLLLENGSKLVLEDGTGDLLLEIAVPVADTAVDDGSWYIHAQQQQQARPRKKREPLLPALVLTAGWTDEELAFLLAADVFG